MSEEQVHRCELCRFWEPPSVEGAKVGYDIGTCHRHAPTIVYGHFRKKEHGNIACLAVWPETTSLEWCGEFQPKLQEKPQ